MVRFAQLIGETGAVLPSYNKDYVEFENYVGSGTVVFDVHTSGKHDLEFTYGDLLFTLCAQQCQQIHLLRGK